MRTHEGSDVGQHTTTAPSEGDGAGLDRVPGRGAPTAGGQDELMGYEVLDAGGDAVRAGDDHAPDAVEVLDLNAATSTPPPPGRHARPPHRGLAAAAALTVLAVGALAVHNGADPAPRPSHLTGPAPTATAPATPADDSTTTTDEPLSTSTDLSTPISLGYARVPGQSVDRQIAALQNALKKRTVNAGYDFEPDRSADGASAPVGVRVVFNRQLSDDARVSAQDALNEVDPTTSKLETVTGTTVDISLPVRPGATCLPVTVPESSTRLTLDGFNSMQIGGLLGTFGMRVTGGRAVVTYIGALRSRAALTRAGTALARACGGSTAQVTYTRGPLHF